MCRSKVIPAHAGNLERLLGDSEFFVGDCCTVADLTVFDILNNFSFNLCASTIITACAPICKPVGRGEPMPTHASRTHHADQHYRQMLI